MPDEKAGEPVNPSVSVASLLALSARQNRLIAQQQRELVLLRLKVDALTWAIATLKEKQWRDWDNLDLDRNQSSGDTTTRDSSGAEPAPPPSEIPEGVEEGLLENTPVAPTQATPSRVREVDPPNHPYQGKYSSGVEQVASWGVTSGARTGGPGRPGSHANDRYKTKVCEICNREYTPSGSRQTLCQMPGCQSNGLSAEQRRQLRIKLGLAK